MAFYKYRMVFYKYRMVFYKYRMVFYKYRMVFVWPLPLHPKKKLSEKNLLGYEGVLCGYQAKSMAIPAAF